MTDKQGAAASSRADDIGASICKIRQNLDLNQIAADFEKLRVVDFSKIFEQVRWDVFVSRLRRV